MRARSRRMVFMSKRKRVRRRRCSTMRLQGMITMNKSKNTSKKRKRLRRRRLVRLRVRHLYRRQGKHRQARLRLLRRLRALRWVTRTNLTSSWSTKKLLPLAQQAARRPHALHPRPHRTESGSYLPSRLVVSIWAIRARQAISARRCSLRTRRRIPAQTPRLTLPNPRRDRYRRI